MASVRYTRRLSGRLIIAAAGVVVLASCSQTTSESTQTSESAQAEESFVPVTVMNCGETIEVSQRPERIVTLNQGATESLLQLGAADQMVGTAYLDDEISPDYAEVYSKIPVLSDKFPSHEQLIEVRPDFVAASYSSAFDEKVAGNREELSKLGIASYLDPFACKDKSQRAPVEWESIKGSARDLGALTGHTAEATALVKDINSKVAEATQAKAGEGKTIFWWDSKTDTPYAGGGKGGPQLLMDTVGATNVFKELDSGWADVSWEAVLAANPDYIVVADASWDTAESKIEFARNDPSLKELDAVKNNRFIVVPFSETTPNVRTAQALARLTDGLKK